MSRTNKQTIAITHSDAFIIFTYSASGEVLYIPKTTLTITYKPSTENNLGNLVYLNWPSGNHPGMMGRLILTYEDVSSPTVASNVALVALLRGYADSIAEAAKIAVSWWGDDTITDTDAYEGKWKSLSVMEAATISVCTDDGDDPSTGIVGAHVAGYFASANGIITNFQLSAAGEVKLIRVGSDGGFAETTTSTTTSTTSTSTTT